jgi:hypothetical protein
MIVTDTEVPRMAGRWESRQAWQVAEAAALVAAVGLVSLVVLGDGAAAAGSGGVKPHKRATPPTRFDKASSATFFDDAFATLQGSRPAFSSVARGPAARPTAGQQAESGGGFKWSGLISEETLTDEVKDRKSDVAGAVAKPTDFKGGGYNAARQAFSSIAVAFGIIAAYDQDVRWKKDAATARDLFARVGFNCKVGTDQSYAESKARLADLESMLDGNAPAGKADRDDDFAWHQVAGRPALMSRLEGAEGVLAAGMASRADFDRGLDAILHDAEIVAAIGEVIMQPDFEYHDDDSYRGYAAAMRDAAVRVREAVRKKDYDAARSAAGELKKSCDACHGDYRS